MTARTKQNLHTAMLNEALAFTKYTLFAECARMNGNPDLAQLFQNTANVDRIEYFRNERDMAGAYMDNSTNLRAALYDKACRIDMYSEFADQAGADGDEAAATLFERIRRRELTELGRFEEALDGAETEARREQLAAA